MAFFNNDDLNGACFIAGELGEVEELRPERTVHFALNHPKATAPFQTVNFSAEQAVEFVEYNAGIQLTHHHGSAAQTTVDEAVKIAYIQFLAARSGLISPEFVAANYHVTYNEAVVTDYTANAIGALSTAPNDRPAGTADNTLRPAFANILTRAFRDNINRNFSNVVCCVAYMFRVRGHHWVTDMDAKYKAVWGKCLKTGENPGINWQLVAHNALHAIMPQILDNYWVKMVQDSNVAGALMKRLDSAPAGVAGVAALHAGMADLATTVPGFKVMHKAQYEELERLVQELQNNRWAGSINRRFYGANDLGFIEGRFAGIASTIMAALDNFASTSKLKESKALVRMAAAAPISGGFTARLIAAAANDPANAKALVEANSATTN